MAWDVLLLHGVFGTDNFSILQILKPMSRLGGITYGRMAEGVEIPRPEWSEMRETAEARGIVKPMQDGQ